MGGPVEETGIDAKRFGVGTGVENYQDRKFLRAGGLPGLFVVVVNRRFTSSAAEGRQQDQGTQGSVHVLELLLRSCGDFGLESFDVESCPHSSHNQRQAPAQNAGRNLMSEPVIVKKFIPIKKPAKEK